MAVTVLGQTKSSLMNRNGRNILERRCIKVSLHIADKNYHQINKIHQLKTLSQPQVYNQNKSKSFKEKETPLCTFGVHKRKRASLTLETAMALPLLLLFAAALLFLFRAMEIQQDVEEAVEYAVRKTAVTMHMRKEDDTKEQGFQILDGVERNRIEGLGEAEVLFTEQVKKSEAALQYVKGGLSGFSFTESDAGEEYVELCVSYRIQNPISLFGLLEYEIHQRAKSHKWIGRTEGEEDSEELVYITATGTAYHRTKECPYLDLSIRTVPRLAVESLRNASGEKYKDCEKCRKNQGSHGLVYITDYGDVCHNSISCSGLKRMIHMALLKDLEGYHPCSKCAR